MGVNLAARGNYEIPSASSRRRTTAADTVCLLVVARALLLVQQDVLPAAGALLSAHMAAKAIRAHERRHTGNRECTLSNEFRVYYKEICSILQPFASPFCG